MEPMLQKQVRMPTQIPRRGWSEFANGELIRAAEAAGFDCIVTADRNLRNQQNLACRKIAIVVLGTNHWDMMRADAPRIVFALANSSPFR